MKFYLLILCCFVQLCLVKTSDDVYTDLRTQFETLKAESKLYSSEIISLAIKIREAMENKENAETSALFDELKYELPLSVRVIIWNENTHIFNKHYSKEYLYAVYDGGSRDSQRRIVYSWIPGGRHSQGQWEFSTKNKGKTFLIKSVQYKEYLYAAADGLAYDSSRRNVFTWRPGSSDGCEWYLEIISDDEIRLKFTTFDEYFYAAGDKYWRNSERRNVFTWRPKSSCDNTCIWRLSPEDAVLTPEDNQIVDDYEKKFDIKFDTPEQKSRALKNIKTAKSIIDLNNDLFQKRERTYKLGLQRFSHLSEDEFTQKYLGLLPSPGNLRRKRAALSAAECKNVPNKINWKTLGRVPKVKDQKECGSCYIFSSTGAIESAVAIEYGISPINMSIQHSLDCIKDPKTGIKNGCTGGRPEWVWDAAKDEDGQVKETKGNEYTGIAGKECDAKAPKSLFTDVESWERIKFIGSPEETEEQIKCRLATSGPFHIGMTVKKNDIGSFISGVYKNSNGLCDTSAKVNHGLLLVGYDDVLIEGDRDPTKIWIIQNSWGERWGEDGYLKVERGVNICGFANDAHFPVLKKTLPAIEKPAVCKEAEDLFDSSKKYLKSLCLIEDDKSYEEAQVFCLNNNMRLFRAETSEKEALFSYASKQWTSREDFTPFINGIEETADGPACTNIGKTNNTFVKNTNTDCTNQEPFVCEFINSKPEQ